MTHNPFNPEPQWHQPAPPDDPREIARGWLSHAPDVDDREEAAARMRRYRPNLWKKVLAWFSVAAGVICALPVLFPETSYGIWDSVASLCVVFLFGFPGAYWLWCNRRDQRTIADWVRRVEEQQHVRRFLTGPELEMFGGTEQAPLLSHRRWGRVVLVEFGLFVLFTVAANLAL